MKHKCSKPFRWGAVTLLAAALALTATCASAQGIKDFLSKAFGSHMNDVADKIAELPDPTSGINVGPMQFSPDGNLLVSIGAQGKFDVWDWRSRRVLRRLDPQANPFDAQEPFAFSPDGRLLAACTMARTPPRTVRVWNTSTWEVAQDIIDSTGNPCNAVAFSADSRILLRVHQYAANDLDDLIVYSTETWQKLWGLHDKRIEAMTLAVSPKGNLVAIGGFRNVPSPGQILGKEEPELALLDLQQRKYVRIIFPASSNSMSWSPDGTSLAVAGVSDFDVYDMRSGEQLAHQLMEHESHLTVRYSPDGKYLVLSSYTGLNEGLGVQIWDAQATRLLQTIAGNAAGIAISRDSRYLAITKHGRIEIWQFK